MIAGELPEWSPVEAAAQLAEQVELAAGRGVVAILVVPDAALAELRAEVRARFPEGPSGDRLVEFRFSGGDDPDGRLRALNFARDRLLRDGRVVLIAVSGPEELRRLQREAVDLVVAPDLLGTVRLPAPERPWSEVARDLRAKMEERHRVLDLTGLVPATAEHRAVELEQVYIDLVDLSRRDEADAAGRHVLVLGDPGAGKTTFLRHLAVRLAGGAPVAGLPPGVPVLVPLADYGQDRERRVRPFAAFLADWLEGLGVAGARAILDHLDEVVLLLDGLDELPEAGARRAVLDELARLEAAAVVVTGRTPVVDDLRAAQVRRFEIVGCGRPDRRQIREVIHRFHRILPRRHGRDPDDLFRRIRQDRALRSLARNPLMLVFLILLHDLDAGLPDRRVEVFHRLGELLVDRWRRARSLARAAGGEGGRSWTPADVMRVLGPLAWAMVKRRGRPVGPAEIEEVLFEVERRRLPEEVAREAARRTLARLERDTALLVRRPGGWAFVHLTVAEFFAAREVLRDGERWARLTARPFAYDSREIVVFAAGILGVIAGEDDRLAELGAAVLRRSLRPGRYDQRHPSLIMGLLDEQPGFAPSLRADLVDRLFRFLFVNAFSPWKAELVQAEAVGFLEAARDKEHGPQVREALKRWLVPPHRAIRWDRVERLKLGNLKDAMGIVDGWVDLSRKMKTRILRDLVWNNHLLLRRLPSLLREYGLDDQPLLDAFRQQERASLRLIGWAAADPPERPGERDPEVDAVMRRLALGEGGPTPD